MITGNTWLSVLALRDCLYRSVFSADCLMTVLRYSRKWSESTDSSQTLPASTTKGYCYTGVFHGISGKNTWFYDLHQRNHEDQTDVSKFHLMRICFRETVTAVGRASFICQCFLWTNILVLLWCVYLKEKLCLSYRYEDNFKNRFKSIAMKRRFQKGWDIIWW